MSGVLPYRSSIPACFEGKKAHATLQLHAQQHLYVMLKKRASPSNSRNSGSFTSTSDRSSTRGSMKPACVAMIYKGKKCCRGALSGHAGGLAPIPKCGHSREFSICPTLEQAFSWDSTQSTGVARSLYGIGMCGLNP
eukprot:992397-Pelagomonas_calceolata.AAC.3